MNKKVFPTQEELRDLIEYDHILGTVFSKKSNKFLKAESFKINDTSFSMVSLIYFYYHNIIPKRVKRLNDDFFDWRITNLIEFEDLNSFVLSQSFIKEYYYYLDGELYTRKIYVLNRNKELNSKIGFLHQDGYVYHKLRGKAYKLHRMIYIYHFGEIPKNYGIDHINGNKSDNRIENLRLCTQAENVQNIKKALITNTSQLLGAHKQGTGYQSEIRINKKRIYLGYYDTAQEAHEVYLKAKKEYHPFWEQGKV